MKHYMGYDGEYVYLIKYFQGDTEIVSRCMLNFDDKQCSFKEAWELLFYEETDPDDEPSEEYTELTLHIFEFIPRIIARGLPHYWKRQLFKLPINYKG